MGGTASTFAAGEVRGTRGLAASRSCDASARRAPLQGVHSSSRGLNAVSREKPPPTFASRDMHRSKSNHDASGAAPYNQPLVAGPGRQSRSELAPLAQRTLSSAFSAAEGASAVPVWSPASGATYRDAPQP